MQLFDMLANAQNGNAVNQLAKQFGLSQQQAQDAVEALLPAFSQGLKRNAANPYDLGSFLSALSTGQHAKYFEDAASAFSPQGVQEGNGILGHLFGSKDLSRAVAAQASQATGIGQDILKQMLPALASMIMGGLFKQSTGQVSAAGFAGEGNPLQQIIEQMMKQGGGLGQPQQQPSGQEAGPLDNPFGKMLEGMLGGGRQGERQPQSRQQNPLVDHPLGQILEGMFGGSRQGERQAPPRQQNPLGQILEGMFGGGRGQAQAERPAQQPRQQQKAPETNPSGRARTPYDDLFGDMFETGRKTRDDYEKNVGSIFDQFLKGMNRPKR